MDYKFLDSSVNTDNIILPDSGKINSALLKNNYADIMKGVDFLASNEKFLHVHGFLGTGKRQYINYLSEFLNRDVIKLEYYCKESTVCDDILLSFIDVVDNNAISKAVNLNQKITTLNLRFVQQISSIKKPFLIILHSFDDILEENSELIQNLLSDILKEDNIKLILSTRAMNPSVMGNIQEDKKIFLKAFSKEVFKDFLADNNVQSSAQTTEDFYKYTRGYYYYTALSVKIIQAMEISLNDFLQKFNQSGMSFDSFLGVTYINLIPTTIRNFFWFLRTIRHGLTLNALAIFELYDEFSIEYLKTNLMIFQVNETIYVQDYFLQNIDISIPPKTEIRLHKYIIGIYEGQLKAPLKDRVINISRQALRAEIEYHNNRISELENDEKNISEQNSQKQITAQKNEKQETASSKPTIAKQIESAVGLYKDKKYTESIEMFNNILEDESIDLHSLITVRLNLANLYKLVGNYNMAAHYYELVETYYKQHKELINLNYLYYDMTDLYFKMYKNERAIDTIKKVIYSVDTPQSLMVSACTLLGNIYSDINNPQESYSYYKKALESLDENVEQKVLADLYFKFALANDDKGEVEQAMEYYNKCITLGENNPYRALAYSNLAACYLDNENYDDAMSCLKKSYSIEKTNNNYEGIYYTASQIAKILLKEGSAKTLDFLIEAKKSAEFINEEFYILESSVALGDYYYNNMAKLKDALKEYIKAKNLAEKIAGEIDISKIQNRIDDMKLRMKPEDFADIESKYGN